MLTGALGGAWGVPPDTAVLFPSAKGASEPGGAPRESVAPSDSLPLVPVVSLTVVRCSTGTGWSRNVFNAALRKLDDAPAPLNCSSAATTATMATH